MTPQDIQDYRVGRLQLLVEKKFNGLKVELARALKHKTGAFVRQMLDRERPISEKTVAAIHALPGLNGWMDVQHTPEVSEADRRRMSPASDESTPVTLGAASMQLAKLVAALSPSRRKTISHLFAAQIAEGPNEHEAKAIDSLAPGVDLVAFAPGAAMSVCEAKPVSDWRRSALHLANAYEDDAIRPYLERFVEEVAQFMADDAQPLKTEQERLIYHK